MSTKKTILLGITASIAAYRMCDLILDLKEKNFKVIPVLTNDAKKFITPLTIQSLAAENVYSDFFAVDLTRIKPIHTELAKESDLIVVCPATADIIAKMRAGFADDLLTCTVLASDKPKLIVPAMNDKMYANPATQENISTLKERGFSVLPPIEGKLVCSDVAMGHIASNDSIVQNITKLCQ